MMRHVVVVALMLAGCSHAEMSATTPAPRANYIAATNIETEASEPAVLVDRAGTISHFECAGRARGGRSFFVERMGL
jgi:hypothetical protein